MKNLVQPSNLELQALSVLWKEGPSTVTVIHRLLPDQRARAYTTVLAVMQNLERKNLVKHVQTGRAHQYIASCSQEKITRHAVEKFTLNTFGGSFSDAILAILSFGHLTPEEKTEIEIKLTQHKTMATKKITTKMTKKAPAKKAAVKAPAKKAAVKAPAKKAPAKAPAKKAPVKAPAKKAAVKAPAKKAAAKAPAKKAAVKAPAKKAAVKAPAKKAAAKAPLKKKK